MQCTFEFQILSSDDDIMTCSLNFRESIVEANEALTRTPFQRVYETWQFKHRKEAVMGPLSAKKVAEEFNSLVRLSRASEAVSEEYVSSCLIVYERGFRHPEVRDAVAWCDGSVWEEHTFRQRCQDEEYDKEMQGQKRKGGLDIPSSH